MLIKYTTGILPCRKLFCSKEFAEKSSMKNAAIGTEQRKLIRLRHTLVKTGDDKNYVWTKLGPNPSRLHKTMKNMILHKNLMFIFSFVQYFSKYC